MATNILMPALSPTMTEGTLSRWLKKEGEQIRAGDVIAEIETDKATMEVEAVDEGVLGKILVADGTAGVKVNEPIGVLVEAGEAVPAAAPVTAPAAAASGPAVPSLNPVLPKSPEDAPAAPVTARSAPAAKPRKNRAPASPVTRQIVVPLSTLNLAVQHQFKDATLYVWVDDKLTLTRQLHGATEKRLVVFSGIRGADSETLNIPAGKHVLRVRTLSADQTIDLSRSITADFIGGADKSLQVTFDKRNSAMRLAWQ